MRLGLPRHTDKFIAGAGAGVTAVALTYPLDTIRARLAFQVVGDTRYTGIANAAVTIFKTVRFPTIDIYINLNLKY